MPSWLMSLLTSIAVTFLKWAVTASVDEAKKAKDKAENDKLNGERDLRNEKIYEQAQTREEQIKAALDLLNRNN